MLCWIKYLYWLDIMYCMSIGLFLLQTNAFIMGHLITRSIYSFAPLTLLTQHFCLIAQFMGSLNPLWNCCNSCCPQWKHAPCTRTMLCSNNAHERDRFHVPVPVAIVKMNAYDYNSAYDYKDKCCQMTELPQYWPGAVQAWALFSQWTKQNR